MLFPILCATPAMASGMQALSGAWARDDGTTRINIAPCGANDCAVNTWVKNPQGKEHVGDVLILMLAPAGNGVFKGKAHDVRRNLNFAMTITLQGTSMTTSGCVVLGIICKDAGWTRISQPGGASAPPG